MSRKRFLLVSPSIFQLHRLIVNNLEYLGYDVVHIENEGYPFQYKSFGQRFYNFIRKLLFKDKTYKMKLREKYTLDRQWEILNSNKPFDLALIIRADFFEEKLIEAVRKKTDLMLGFHYDGISRNPEILQYIRYFDRFYVFDPNDVQRYPSYNLRFSPNFYFDYPALIKSGNPNAFYQVFYVSAYHKSRIDTVIRLHRYLADYYKKVKFTIVCPIEDQASLPVYVKENMEVRHTYLLFEEQLNFIASADVIIDLVIGEHKGYSFRVFEGLKFEKKVITSNESVAEADFYHPHNFFILREDNYDEIDEFIRLPYMAIDEQIVKNYGFSHWLKEKIEGE